MTTAEKKLQPELLEALKWAEKQLAATVTEDAGNGAFIRYREMELVGFGAGMKRLRSAIAKAESR